MAVYGFDRAKRLVKIVFGFTLLGLGVIGLFLPVLQGWLFIALGLGLLAGEYVWARRLLHRVKTGAGKVKDAVRGTPAGPDDRST